MTEPPLGYEMIIVDGPRAVVRALKHISKYDHASPVSVVPWTNSVSGRAAMVVFFECETDHVARCILMDWSEAEATYQAARGVRSGR